MPKASECDTCGGDGFHDLSVGPPRYVDCRDCGATGLAIDPDAYPDAILGLMAATGTKWRRINGEWIDLPEQKWRLECREGDDHIDGDWTARYNVSQARTGYRHADEPLGAIEAVVDRYNPEGRVAKSVDPS